MATKTRPSPASRRSPTPAPSPSSPVSPGPCWYHKKHGNKAQHCGKPCSESEKLAVGQVELSFQPAGFLDALPEPEPEPEMCSYSLMFLKDILSDREFLVYSCASVSMFPGLKSTSSDGVRLLTADGSPMICSGNKIIPL